MAITAGMVILAYRLHNPDKGAEHYFSRHHKVAYWALHMCYAVIVAALFFNARYVVQRFVSGVSPTAKQAMIRRVKSWWRNMRR